MQEIKHPNLGQMSEEEDKYLNPPIEILASIWDVVDYGVFVLDIVDGVQLQLTYANSAFLKISKFSLQQLLSNNIQKIFDISVIQHFYEVLDLDHQMTFEGQLFTDCLDHWASFTIIPITENNSSCNRLVVTFTNITQQKQRENKLHETQEQLRKLFDLSGDAILLFDDTGIFDCNAAALKMLNCSDKNQIIGLNSSQLSPVRQPDGRLSAEKTQEMDAIAWQNGCHRYEWMYRRFDGENFWVEVLLTHIPMDHKSIIHVTWREISDRKATEEALFKQEKQYHSIFQAVSDGLIISELETSKVVEVNPSAHQMHGYSYDEFLELDIREWVHPDNHQLLYQFIEQVTMNGEFSSQGQDIRKDGTVFDVDVKGTLCMYDDRLHILTLIRDISQRRAAEEAQKIAQARLQYLIAESPGVIYSCKVSDGYPLNFISSNSSAIFGYEAEEFMQNPTFWMNRIHPEDIDNFMAVIPQLIAHGKHVNEYRFQHKDGTYRWIHNEAKIARDENGKPLEIIGHSFDVTQRKTAEFQLQQQAAELAVTLQELKYTQTQIIQAEKMSSLGQLVAGVAHEINNPVSFIYSNLEPAREYIADLLKLMELYQQHYPEPATEIQDEIENTDLEFIKTDLPKLLSSMKIGADRIKKIVLSLRNFSRMDESEYKSVNIHEGIDSTLIILEHRLKAQPNRPAIQIIKEYADLPPVECYAGQMNQVFMNILVNALDALDERDSKRSIEEIEKLPSLISITTKVIDSRQVLIQISDNGSGIPVEVEKRLFEPFFTTKPIGKGTGMGLSISYQIITEKHGGSLECISSPKQGSIFAIKIPLKQLSQPCS
ncbi:PAS domain S-box protein [Calothrix sp. PCC 6303]|uniref:PAS domain S-box protein n=1 Tax=Calothrix sp. PCC 6303 TaxID=1170562 RepID=UPI0002A042AB|nr:PAS domain S-box protein [Calothrix sp. PCC 6303]AFZ04358.1 PAS/PAC sensor signal transduction histidine kinase [Calothrix sp. PCC 6303]